MTEEQFLELTGIEMPDDTAMKLKDFAEAHGLEMETIRSQITDTLQQ